MNDLELIDRRRDFAKGLSRPLLIFRFDNVFLNLLSLGGWEFTL